MKMNTKVAKHLLETETALEKLRKALEAESDEMPEALEEELHRTWSLLAQIANRGGEVTTEEFYAIGDELGYDRRGLGGFFRGKFRSLDMDHSTGIRRLTPAGKGFVDRWSAHWDNPAA
jgi:hypothetical protein